MTLPWRATVPAAAILGGFSALAQAPFDVPVVLLPCIAGVIWLWGRCLSAWQSAATGWSFGAGYFGLTLVWILQPFQVDAATHGWMAPFALVFLAGGLALFWGAGFGLARRWNGHLGLLIGLWTCAELVRAYVFTGFPWAMFPQGLVNTLAGQGLAWVGPHGLTFLILALAAAIAGAQNLILKGVLLVGGTALIVPVQAPDAAMTDHHLRLVQPNAAQHLKWDPDMMLVFYERQLDLIAGPAKGAEPDLVILPETAIPWAVDLASFALAEISRSAGHQPVLMGAQRRAGRRFFNSAVVLDETGMVAQKYDKHHLVPFGEYFPLGDFAARFGLHGLAAQEGRGYSAGKGAQLLDFGPVGKALPLICYEAVFAHDVNAAPERPDFLIQMTNDAWFGKDAGPLQHLAQAQMRAIEQGLPLARSANTGVSAMIDPFGRVLHALEMDVTGYIDARLPAPLPATLYSKTGDAPFAVLLLCGLVFFRLRAGPRKGH